VSYRLSIFTRQLLRIGILTQPTLSNDDLTEGGNILPWRDIVIAVP